MEEPRILNVPKVNPSCMKQKRVFVMIRGTVLQNRKKEKLKKKLHDTFRKIGESPPYFVENESDGSYGNGLRYTH